MAQWVGYRPQSKMSPVQFPAKAHAYVVGSVPGQGTYNVSLSHGCFSPSLSPSTPLSLKISKENIFKTLSYLFCKISLN